MFNVGIAYPPYYKPWLAYLLPHLRAVCNQEWVIGHNYLFINKFQNGKYTFKATYPGVYNERPIPHIHYKVSIIKVTILPQIVSSYE